MMANLMPGAQEGSPGGSQPKGAAKKHQIHAQELRTTVNSSQFSSSR
jgi:hypothetical protein